MHTSYHSSFLVCSCELTCVVSGLGYTEGITQASGDVFTHTTSEKAEFVRDFLFSLEIEKYVYLLSNLMIFR